jgi:hypothetical protein
VFEDQIINEWFIEIVSPIVRAQQVFCPSINWFLSLDVIMLLLDVSALV